MTAPGAPAAAGNDKTTVFGVLGIILALPFCCWPVGLVFAILSLLQANKYGKQPTLAYVGFAIVGLSFILTILNFALGWYEI